MLLFLLFFYNNRISYYFKKYLFGCLRTLHSVFKIWWQCIKALYTLALDLRYLLIKIQNDMHQGSVQSCPTLCDPMGCRTVGFPVHCQLLELAQTHVHWVGDAIQPAHALLPTSPPALNLSQHQGLFQQVGSSYQVVKVLELQHQSFQWIFRVDFS